VKGTGVRGRLFPRLLATFLAAFLPFAIIMAVLLTNRGGAGIERSVDAAVRTGALSLASRTNDFLGNRARDVRFTATAIEGLPERDQVRQAELLQELRTVYDAVALLDLDARPVAVSPAGAHFPAQGTDWFASASAGQDAVGTPTRDGNAIDMVLAAPVMDGKRVARVLAVDLDLSSIYGFVQDATLGRSGTSLLISPAGQVMVQTSTAQPRTEADLLQSGSLRETVDTAPARRVLQGQSGVDEHVKIEGNEYVSGFAPVKTGGWGAIVREDRDEAFSAVGDQRSLAALILLAGILFAAVAAYLFARQAARPIDSIRTAARSVAGGDLSARVEPDGTVEFRELSGSFNTMVGSMNSMLARIDDTSSELSSSASELAAAAEQLAATTQEQSTAATETSATMEELARTFTSIADTVSGVAAQTQDTREVLEETDKEIEASSQRALTLAQRVVEISGLLDLINEIADQTNLLALNAAIEAARAGESGRGFTVVADEVRRLAERSKAQAEEIGRIVEDTQSETNATVMAMEASSKQMRRGLDLMDQVAEATERVRLTTQQQSAAASQVVDTMEAVTETSRQTSTTAQQIAAAASQLTALVDELRKTSAGVEARQ
jgi:methyl-accepting chemotaxis protein